MTGGRTTGPAFRAAVNRSQRAFAPSAVWNAHAEPASSHSRKNSSKTRSMATRSEVICKPVDQRIGSSTPSSAMLRMLFSNRLAYVVPMYDP